MMHPAYYELATGRGRMLAALRLMDRPTIGDPLILWTVGLRQYQHARRTLRAAGLPIPRHPSHHQEA